MLQAYELHVSPNLSIKIKIQWNRQHGWISYVTYVIGITADAKPIAYNFVHQDIPWNTFQWLDPGNQTYVIQGYKCHTYYTCTKGWQMITTPCKTLIQH